VKPAVTPEAAAPAENADKTAEEVMQPEPEPKPEVKPEVKPEPKPEIKPEAKPAVKPEAKAAPKPVTKPEPKAPKAEEKKSAAKEPAPEKLDKYSAMDARVRTGAYRIVGTEKVVKVKEGDNLRKISNRVLGPDMECYLEVYNGMKTSTPLKVGQEIKVPKLQLKKKKKPQTVN
jgi:outer membrane biosynthesis protein TonB